MLIVTSETISGKNLEMLGIVKGSTIQTVNAIKDIGSGLKTLVGGERYITPELKELEEKALSAKERALVLENEIFNEIIRKP